MGILTLRQSVSGPGTLAWHQHDQAYAAIVIEGAYLEAGDEGRRHVRAGDVIIHRAFSAHRDEFAANGAKLVNIMLPPDAALTLRSGAVEDPHDLIAQIEADPSDSCALMETFVIPSSGCNDLVDQLASQLIERPQLELARWYEEAGPSGRTVRRQFSLAYGVSPVTFRARSRARKAVELLVTGTLPIAQIAHHLGFADQSHMSREVRSLTRQTPRAWKSSARLRGGSPSADEGLAA